MSRYRLRNFTPVPDELIKKYGGTAALVYGRVWRFTNGGLRDCTASVGTIAESLGLSVPTVRKSLQALIKHKEIIDKTPDRKNAPHVLNITKQLSLSLSMEFEKGSKNLSTRYKETLHKDTTKDKDLKDSRSKTKRSTNNRVRKALEEQFTDSTRLKSPPMNTVKQKKAAGELWWAPLREIAELAELDTLRGQSLIRRTVDQMRKDKLTISSPKSILNVAKSIVAEGTGRSISGAREFLDDLRRTTD